MPTYGYLMSSVQIVQGKGHKQRRGQNFSDAEIHEVNQIILFFIYNFFEKEYESSSYFILTAIDYKGF